MTPEKHRAEQCAGAGNSGCVPGGLGLQAEPHSSRLLLLSSHLTTGVVDPLATNKCFAAALQTSPPCHDPDHVLSALALQAEG